MICHYIKTGTSWSWSDGWLETPRAINTYHHWSCEFESRSWRCVLDTTLCDQVCQRLPTGRWFSQVSSTNDTDSLHITEIWLKVTLNTINQTTFSQSLFFVYHFLVSFTCVLCCLLIDSFWLPLWNLQPFRNAFREWWNNTSLAYKIFFFNILKFILQ